MLYIPSRQIWTPPAVGGPFLEPSPPARARLARVRSARAEATTWRRFHPEVFAAIQGLINGGLVNDGHALVDAGVIRAHTTGPNLPAPTLFFRMDDTSGSNVAESVGGNDLTQHNTLGSAAGKVGNARSFTNASSMYADHADAAAFQFNAITTAGLWFNLASKSSFRTLYCKAGATNSTADTEYQGLYHSGNNRMEFSIYDTGSTQYTISAISNPSTSTWYCVVIIWDGANLSISVNGAAFTTQVAAALPRTTANNFYLGSRNPASGLYMDGQIDAVFFHKGTAWNQTQATLFYNGLGVGAGTEFYGGQWH